MLTNLKGEKRRVALCRLLVSQPDILLLDEPTNHLDAESVPISLLDCTHSTQVAWLERYLLSYKGTVMVVTHDRYFLDNVTDWILELDRGRPFVYKGNYTKWLEERQRRVELEEKQESSKMKMIAKELEWIHQNPKGRTAKSKVQVT